MMSMKLIEGAGKKFFWLMLGFLTVAGLVAVFTQAGGSRNLRRPGEVVVVSCKEKTSAESLLVITETKVAYDKFGDLGPARTSTPVDCLGWNFLNLTAEYYSGLQAQSNLTEPKALRGILEVRTVDGSYVEVAADDSVGTCVLGVSNVCQAKFSDVSADLLPVIARLDPLATNATITMRVRLIGSTATGDIDLATAPIRVKVNPPCAKEIPGTGVEADYTCPAHTL